MASWLWASSSAVDPRRRVFGGAENAIMKLSQQRQGYMKVGEVLFLQGPPVSGEALARAVRDLQRRHPFLRSRLQMNPAAADTFLVEEDEMVQLKIREVTRRRDEYRDFWRREWRDNEKQVPKIGEPLAELWVLQDPKDQNDDHAPREIVFVCEHSISDGVSLSVVAHELLIALSQMDRSLFETSLPWPKTMENAIQDSLSTMRRTFAFARFIYAAIYSRITNGLPIAKLPLGNVDFPLSEMATRCHTASIYGSLNKEETARLIDQCHKQGITVTPAVGSAILAAIVSLVDVEENQDSRLSIAIAADTRRRCTPAVPNHDLSYHVAGTLAFTIPRKDAPSTTAELWQVAKNFAEHIRYCINSHQILMVGAMMGKLYQKSLDPPNMAQVPSCGLSSWGALPFQEQYGPWQLTEMIPLCNLISVVTPMILFQTVNGILTIGCMGPDPVIATSYLERLCQGTMEKLRQMILDS